MVSSKGNIVQIETGRFQDFAVLPGTLLLASPTGGERMLMREEQ